MTASSYRPRLVQAMMDRTTGQLQEIPGRAEEPIECEAGRR